MIYRKVAQFVCALTLLSAGLLGQTVSGSLAGTVLDPDSAAVPNATVTVADKATGAVQTASTDTSGVFRFLDVAPGAYSLVVKAAGFKTLNQSNVTVEANQPRDVGRLNLELGSTTDTVTVTAEAPAIQVSSSEKAFAITGEQLASTTLTGRDMFGYLKLIPGVIDTNADSRDVTSPNSIAGIYINGNTSALNFTVDGVTNMDTGSNHTVHYEPNIDSIQEMKILTSNYQAEFGRNSGGTITVVTKSGTRQFHGSMLWNHRNEGFNANLWQNNKNGRNAAGQPVSPISRYRYNVETYTLGGPVLIPKHFNTDRKKLFFFWSQEYTGQFVPGSVQNKYTPTALERQGDFSQSLQNNGSLIVIKDPVTASPFPGNRIPASRITPLGQAMLNFFPLPNFVGTGSQANVVNYFDGGSAPHTRRNDVLRLDTYLTSKLNGYFRYMNDYDDQMLLYQGVQFSRGAGGLLGDTGIAPIDHYAPGHGYSGTLNYTLSPTLVNQTTVSKSWNTYSYFSPDNFKSESRSLLPGIPTLFPIPTTNSPGMSAVNGYQSILPQFSFGTPPSNSMSFTRNGYNAGNYENFNTIWTVTNNLSKVWRQHTFKAGAYIEHNVKIAPTTSSAYAGNFIFSPDSLNGVNNSGNGYANALLGYVDSYSQATSRAVYCTIYWNQEYYVQDNFRATKRLTLEYGVRFYHDKPQEDKNGTYSNFAVSRYSKSAAPRVYIPGTSNGSRVAIDPGTGAVAPVAYIGTYVPNSGNPSNGFQLLGVNGTPRAPYTQAALAAAPRVGFAYDLSGNGKTALRGGFGVFYNRLAGDPVYTLSGQPPFTYTPTVYYTTFAQIAAASNSLVSGPSTYSMWPVGNIPLDRVQNASLNVQHQIGSVAMIDVGYSGNWGYNQNLNYDINSIPIGTRAPFNTTNADATNGGKSLPDILLRSVYPGYNTINGYNNLGHTNYNALTAALRLRRSRGLMAAVAYTYSKALGTVAYNPVVPNNESWNYGPLSFDRRHNLQINYTYDFPNLGKRLGSRLLGVLVDRWTLSGITSVQSGFPFSPGFNINGTSIDYTGTPNVSARPVVVGDPFANVPAGHYFNPAAFAPPALGTNITTPTLGNMGGGSGVMWRPLTTNFDATMSKSIPIGTGERCRVRIQAQAYNALNHPEFTGINSTVQFNAAGAVVNAAQAGTYSGTARARVMAFSARVEF